MCGVGSLTLAVYAPLLFLFFGALYVSLRFFICTLFLWVFSTFLFFVFFSFPFSPSLALFRSYASARLREFLFFTSLLLLNCRTSPSSLSPSLPIPPPPFAPLSPSSPFPPPPSTPPPLHPTPHLQLLPLFSSSLPPACWSAQRGEFFLFFHVRQYRELRGLVHTHTHTHTHTQSVTHGVHCVPHASNNNLYFLYCSVPAARVCHLGCDVNSVNPA